MGFFPSTRNVPLGLVSDNIKDLGKQNSLFPLVPVVKLLLNAISRYQLETFSISCLKLRRFRGFLLFLSIEVQHLMTGPSENSEFCFPSSRSVPLGLVSDNIEGLAKQNPLFSWGQSLIACYLMPSPDTNSNLLQFSFKG